MRDLKKGHGKLMKDISKLDRQIKDSVLISLPFLSIAFLDVCLSDSYDETRIY